MSPNQRFQELLQKITLTHDLGAAKQLVALLEAEGAEEEPRNVWAVYISHRHGNGINVFSNEEAVWDYLYWWAAEYWSELPVGRMDEELEAAIPRSPSGSTLEEKQRSVSFYFNCQRDRGQEFYLLEKATLDDEWLLRSPRAPESDSGR